MKTFDEKIKEVAERYGQYEHCGLEIAFRDGVAWLRANLKEVPEVKVLVEALEKYADIKNYDDNTFILDCGEDSFRHGLTAQEALAQFNTDKGDRE